MSCARLFLLVLCFLFSGIPFTYSDPAFLSPSLAYLVPLEDVRANAFYGQLIGQYRSGKVSEHTKILYLIRLVRDSPCLFVRNGKEYRGPKASSHLTQKYRKARQRVRDAGDFIEKVASRSEATRIPYAIKFSDGSTLPASKVLANELERLEECLRFDRDAGLLPQK